MILDGQLDTSVQAAAQALQAGQLLGLPTETVYGLAADSDNDAAMLKAAGTSVAMGNATHGIECFCDMTTTDIHDDGIANAFVTLGLI